MPRPRKMRRIMGNAPVDIFKPAGVPARHMEKSVLNYAEFEAVRLADLEGFTQEQGAESMQVSRATFGRIVNNARKKIADAIVNGKALVIDRGGPIIQSEADIGEQEIQPQQATHNEPPNGPGGGRGPGCGGRGRGKNGRRGRRGEGGGRGPGRRAD